MIPQKDQGTKIIPRTLYPVNENYNDNLQYMVRLFYNKLLLVMQRSSIVWIEWSYATVILWDTGSTIALLICNYSLGPTIRNIVAARTFHPNCLPTFSDIYLLVCEAHTCICIRICVCVCCMHNLYTIVEEYYCIFSSKSNYEYSMKPSQIVTISSLFQLYLFLGQQDFMTYCKHIQILYFQFIYSL